MYGGMWGVVVEVVGVLFVLGILVLSVEFECWVDFGDLVLGNSGGGGGSVGCGCWVGLVCRNLCLKFWGC